MGIAKYRQVTEWIQNRIATGELNRGDHRNLGRKSLEEVINKLAMMGLSLASEDNN